MARNSQGRRLAGIALAILILTLTLLPAAQPVEAASAGYIYLVDWQELTVAYDPITLRSGLLLPEELLKALGVTVSAPGAGQVKLQRGSLTAKLQFGLRTATANDHHLTLPTSPLRLSGHLFVPAAILPELGIQVTEDGALILIDRWPLNEAAVVDETAYARAVQGSSTTAYVTVNRTDLLAVGLTRLTDEIVRNQAWTANAAVRGRSLSLLADHLLVEVSIFNQGTSFYTFDPTNLYLVDDHGRQYRATSEVIPLAGDPVQPLAPSASARAVVVFPLPDGDATLVTLYSPLATSALTTYLVNR